IDGKIEKIATDCAFGENAPRVWKLSQLFLDLNGQFLNLAKIRTKNFYAEDAAKSRGQHFGARLDRHPENIRHSRRLNVRINFCKELLPGHSAPPLVRRLQRDDGLKHRQRRRVR